MKKSSILRFSLLSCAFFVALIAASCGQKDNQKATNQERSQSDDLESTVTQNNNSPSLSTPETSFVGNLSSKWRIGQASRQIIQKLKRHSGMQCPVLGWEE